MPRTTKKSLSLCRPALCIAAQLSLAFTSCLCRKNLKVSLRWELRAFWDLFWACTHRGNAHGLLDSQEYVGAFKALILQSFCASLPGHHQQVKTKDYNSSWMRLFCALWVLVLVPGRQTVIFKATTELENGQIPQSSLLWPKSPASFSYAFYCS